MAKPISELFEALSLEDDEIVDAKAAKILAEHYVYKGLSRRSMAGHFVHVTRVKLRLFLGSLKIWLKH